MSIVASLPLCLHAPPHPRSSSSSSSTALSGRDGNREGQQHRTVSPAMQAQILTQFLQISTSRSGTLSGRSSRCRRKGCPAIAHTTYCGIVKVMCALAIVAERTAACCCSPYLLVLLVLVAFHCRARWAQPTLQLPPLPSALSPFRLCSSPPQPPSCTLKVGHFDTVHV